MSSPASSAVAPDRDARPAPGSDRSSNGGYLSFWRSVPRELGFLLPNLVIVLVGYVVLVALVSIGSSLLTIFVGVFALAAAMFVARWFGGVELARLRVATRRTIERPPWKTDAARGFWARTFSPFTDGHYWLYLLHGLVINPIVGIVTWVVSFTWSVTTLAALTAWIWERSVPDAERRWYLFEVLREFLAPGAARPEQLELAENALWALIGLVMLGLLPFITRLLTLVHWWIARGMLGRFRSESLEERVAEVSASRTAAVAAEGHALRRLERDIHDGPQQRLVRLQMDLAAAERQLDADPVAARALVSEAMQQSKDALEELRALSRGFAPPILLDRGLATALDSLALRNAVPVVFANELPEGIDLPDEIERNAYFIAAELLTNAAKHSGAAGAELRVGVRDEAAGRWLEVSVRDSGAGGARLVEGHGLAGLHERVRGVGGSLELSSPVGGPTIVTARLPVAG